MGNTETTRKNHIVDADDEKQAIAKIEGYYRQKDDSYCVSYGVEIVDISECITKNDNCVEAWVNGEYASFVVRHGSWNGCVFFEPFNVVGKNEYIYKHGAGKSKDDLIQWVTETINTKSYLREQ
jgi:hypothetical protein